VQACGEAFGSIAWFEFFTLEVIQRELNRNITKFFCRIKKTCRTMLHGFKQNHARPKNICKKKARKTGARQSSMGCI
jgi:hypothetical protein